ncbi:MAG TPA: phospholipase D-like domain-containing protein [Kofleriaceae bacterium]|nr:phospholipase D-like domain-containing protein [Kofleriaceae bacterium]
MKSAVLFALALALVACRPADEAADDVDAAVVLPDAPDGMGCTALTPRTVPVESFVGPTGLETKMGQLIDGAQSTLDIQMYLFTVDSIAQKVIAAKQRGVVVRMLLDKDEAGNMNVTPDFTAANVNWKWAPSLYTYSHAKYMIIDKSQAVIMSMNWNVDAMRTERNYGIVDKDIEDIADVQSIFDADWALTNGTGNQAANLTCTRLVVSPTNSRQRLIDHIKTATTNLDVEVMYVSESSIRDEIIAAKQRGVTVRVIILDPAADEVVAFKAASIPVKTPPSSFYLHAKLIIADTVAFVGSENMSFTSLTKNREVGALVFEPTAFMPIKTQFEADWTASIAVP